jgi:molecular chaperone DnaK (HSP70)
VANSVLFPTRFLGLNSDCQEQIDIEKRYISNKLMFFENKKVGFIVRSQGEEYTFTVEQLLGFFLTKLKKFYEKDDVNAKEMVISIPSYCTNVERQSLIDAA